MYIPSAKDTLASIFEPQDENYLKGYVEGYEVAKKEMMDMIRAMQALHTSGTVTV